jgi:hypothetical protein
VRKGGREGKREGGREGGGSGLCLYILRGLLLAEPYMVGGCESEHTQGNAVHCVHPCAQAVMCAMLTPPPLTIHFWMQAHERVEADLGDADSRFRDLGNLLVHVKVKSAKAIPPPVASTPAA